MSRISHINIHSLDANKRLNVSVCGEEGPTNTGFIEDLSIREENSSLVVELPTMEIERAISILHYIRKVERTIRSHINGVITIKEE